MVFKNTQYSVLHPLPYHKLFCLLKTVLNEPEKITFIIPISQDRNPAGAASTDVSGIS